MSPEIKARMAELHKNRQIHHERMRPRDSRERQSVEILNNINEKKLNSKYEQKYDLEIREYRSMIRDASFKNNSASIKGVFSHSGLKFPEINLNN